MICEETFKAPAIDAIPEEIHWMAQEYHPNGSGMATGEFCFFFHIKSEVMQIAVKGVHLPFFPTRDCIFLLFHLCADTALVS